MPSHRLLVLIFSNKKRAAARRLSDTLPPHIRLFTFSPFGCMMLKRSGSMFEKTLTDVLIERGLIPPMSSCCILDGDESDCFILDGDDPPKNEEKSRE
jgi:hypothetical protein